MLRGAKNAAPVKKCTNTWRADFTRPRHGQFPVNRQLETTSDPRQQVHDFARSTFVSTIVAPKLFPPPPFVEHCTYTHIHETLVPCTFIFLHVYTRRMRDRGGNGTSAEEEIQGGNEASTEEVSRGKREDCRPPSSYQQFLFPRHQNFRPLLLPSTLHVLISYRTQCSERERI